jgi:drug/metabolite transporter (DMT)-like permease
VVVLGFFWGGNWIATKIALAEMTPWSVRIAGLGLATMTLLLAAQWRGTSLALPRGWPRLHIVVAALLNVVGFNMLTAFAQLGSTTSRVVIVAYTMPIWAAVLARFVLRERLSALRVSALILGIAGLAILIRPLLATGLPQGLLFAFASAWSWAAGTVYLKWARLDAAPLAVAVWQLGIGATCVLAYALAFEPASLQIWPLHPASMLALAYNGLIGLGVAYLLWFEIVMRLPAITASLGVLIVPVVGVVLSMLILGDSPPLTDLIGFALIFAGAASVLILPSVVNTPTFLRLQDRIVRRFGR